MLILVTNDDGIDSPGITALADALKEIGEVVVSAPDRQQSAVGHALTIANPLRAYRYEKNGEFFGWAVNGTPADSVKLALTSLLDRKPDMLISGINHGPNTSINVIYSGTVSGAVEGMFSGIPSMAVSLDSWDYSEDCTNAARCTLKIAKYLSNIVLPEGTILNVNIPVNEIRGVKLTKQSKSVWKDSYEKRTDPFGREYYWFAGDYLPHNGDPDTDDAALNEGYASITPIHFEFTNNDFLEEMKKIGTNFS